MSTFSMQGLLSVLLALQAICTDVASEKFRAFLDKLLSDLPSTTVDEFCDILRKHRTTSTSDVVDGYHRILRRLLDLHPSATAKEFYGVVQGLWKDMTLYSWKYSANANSSYMQLFRDILHELPYCNPEVAEHEFSTLMKSVVNSVDANPVCTEQFQSILCHLRSANYPLTKEGLYCFLYSLMAIDPTITMDKFLVLQQKLNVPAAMKEFHYTLDCFRLVESSVRINNNCLRQLTRWLKDKGANLNIVSYMGQHIIRIIADTNIFVKVLDEQHFTIIEEDKLYSVKKSNIKAHLRAVLAGVLPGYLINYIKSFKRSESNVVRTGKQSITISGLLYKLSWYDADYRKLRDCERNLEQRLDDIMYGEDNEDLPLERYLAIVDGLRTELREVEKALKPLYGSCVRIVQETIELYRDGNNWKLNCKLGEFELSWPDLKYHLSKRLKSKRWSSLEKLIDERLEDEFDDEWSRWALSM